MFWIVSFRITTWWWPWDTWVYLTRCLDVSANISEAEMFDSPVTAAAAYRDLIAAPPKSWKMYLELV